MENYFRRLLRGTWYDLRTRNAQLVRRLRRMLFEWLNILQFIGQSGFSFNRECSLTGCSPVAQLIEHRLIMREVVSSTPTGPTLRVLKLVSRKCLITSANGSTFQSSSIMTLSRRSRLTTLVVNNCGTLKNPDTIRKE